MCVTQGDDAHPNTIGYAAIARAVETTLATI
jgi:lysophospholipase L1-like esterase